MPAADTISTNATTAEVVAYDAYTKAVSAHTIIMATPGASLSDRIEAFRVVAAEYKKLMATFGAPEVQPAGLAQIKALKEDVARLNQAIRSAHAMLFSADVIGCFNYLPDDKSRHVEFNAGVTLFIDAQDVLFRAMPS